MRNHHTCILLSLSALLFACNAARGESESAASAQSTSRDANEPAQAPVQISEYPGAPHQDRDGNLWFGTVQAGLTRYDGKEFVTFTMKDGLAGDSIRGTMEDKDGILWFATTKGLSKYDGESFTTLAEYEGTYSTAGSFSGAGNHRDLWDVMRDRNGELWIASMDGAFRHDGKSFVRFPMPVVAPEGVFEFAPKMVYEIFEDKVGDLWFGTDGAGVVRYDGEKMIVYTEKGDGLASDRVCEIEQDLEGNMWFGTSGGGVSRYDGERFETFLRTETFSKHTGWGRYMAVHVDRAGHVWIGCSITGGGVYRYDGKTFEYLSEDAGLGKGGVPSIREDRNGNLWFGTTAGVYQFDGERFINFTKSDPFKVDPPPAISFEDWPTEIIALPPDFAPELPTGVESLLFAPGWRDPSADGFWAYAFVMWIDEAAPDAARIIELMESYYEGLMTAVAGPEAERFGGDMAQIEVVQSAPGQFELKMHLINSFGELEAIELLGLIETVAESESKSSVRIQVSPQPNGHDIWRALDAAVASIRKP